jgi:hypothetical protein
MLKKIMNIFKGAKTITVKMSVLDNEAKNAGKSLKGKVNLYLSQELAKEIAKGMSIRKYRDPKNLNATIFEGSVKVK